MTRLPSVMHINDFMELVTPYKDKLYRFALRIVGNRFEAEDVVQEVLIKVWKKKEHFLSITNKEAWCMTLTRNLAIDKTRARKVKTNDIDQFFHLKDSSTTPDVAAESSDTMKQIQAIINTLPDKQREILHLRDVEGFTYKEISEITDFKIDQVKVYLHRARKILRQKLVKFRK